MKVYIVYKEWTDQDSIVEHENKVFLNENDAKEEFNKIKEELITKSEICEWKIIFPSSTKPTSEFFDVRSNDEEEGERICLYTREVK